jgi:hypothetical protein
MQELTKFDDLIRWSGIEAIETTATTSTAAPSASG